MKIAVRRSGLEIVGSLELGSEGRSFGLWSGWNSSCGSCASARVRSSVQGSDLRSVEIAVVVV